MDLLTTIFAVSPLLLIIAIVLPLLVAEMGIQVLPTLFDPDFYADILNKISQLDLGELLEILKEAIRVHMEMY